MSDLPPLEGSLAFFFLPPSKIRPLFALFRMAGDAPWEEFIDADASSPTVLKERDIVFLE